MEIDPPKLNYEIKLYLQKPENTLPRDEKILSKQKSLTASISDIGGSIMTLVQSDADQEGETLNPLIENLISEAFGCLLICNTASHK